MNTQPKEDWKHIKEDTRRSFLPIVKLEKKTMKKKKVEVRKVKRGQIWKAKNSGIILEVLRKATGNNHWTVKTSRGKSHHIHEGTLKRFYETL